VCSFRPSLPTLPKATPAFGTSLFAVRFILWHGCAHRRPLSAVDDTLPVSLGNPIRRTRLGRYLAVLISSLSRFNFQGDLA
jgi:hypothetical protein